MKTKTETIDNAKGGLSWIMSSTNKFAPKIYLEKEDETGSDDKESDADKEAAKAAAEKAAAEKAEKEAKEKEKNKDKTSDKEAELLKEVMAKKAKEKALEKELADLKKKFEGVDPEEVKKIMDERAEREKKAAEDKGDFERVKEMMKKEHEKELAKIKEQLKAHETSLAEAASKIKSLTIGSAFASSQFINEELVAPKKAKVIFGNNFEFQDGKVVGFDKPKDASDRTMLVDSSGDPLDFESAIKKLVEMDEDKDNLLKSKIKKGTNSSDQTFKGDKGEKKSELKGLSRIQAALAARK